jgi:glutathione S-transferase
MGHAGGVTAPLVLVGRSSSHFTRITRLFAEELGVPYTLQVVTDLRATESAGYGGNPALRMPTLLAPSGIWYGSLNICRELGRLAPSPRRLVWPEQLPGALLSNLQELTLQAMATEVELVMNDAPPESSTLARKRRESLQGTLTWLDHHSESALALLPERDLSYLEAALYCLVTHLEFRNVLPTEPYESLRRFAAHFGQRQSAQRTAFRFD